MFTRASQRRLLLTGHVLIAGLYLFRLALLPRHAFDPDEFQHLHGAWCIARGLLPYRDYFEHHTPWLHFFLAAFLPFFDVDRSPAAAERFVVFARAVMWAFSGLALALTFRLGRLCDGRAAACAGTVLLSTTVMFLDKTLEVRPDVPAVAFLLGSWIALLLGMRCVDEHRCRRLFAQSGFLLGVALLCTQKVLFTVPGLALMLARYVLDHRAPVPLAWRLRGALFNVAGVLVPVGVVLAVFAWEGGLTDFLRFNVLVNARWPVRWSPEPVLRRLVYENGLVVALGIAGFASTAAALLRRDAHAAGRVLLASQVVGLGTGAFLIPVPYPQYFVTVLPLLALLAGSAGARLAVRISRLPSRPARIAGLAAAAAAAAVLSARPLRMIAAMARPPHTKAHDQLQRVRYVVGHTSPSDRVMDGFTGLGVFRPHAYFYFFLHDEIRALLAGRETSRLLARLRDGGIAPEWIVMDRDMLALRMDVVAFLHDNYEPTEAPPLWRRKEMWIDEGDAWLDLGAGPTDALAGQGWYRPQSEGARTFRRSRGRRSSVRLAVRNPAVCRRLVVRARPEYAPGRATVYVEVNGTPLGAIRLAPGWTDYALPLDGTLRIGVNTLELIYDPVPREDRPAYAGGNALAAVDGFRLECDVVAR